MQNLRIFQNNSCVITQEIPSEFVSETGATIVLNVHSNEFTTGTTLFQVTGSTHLGVVTFDVTNANNTLPIRVYFYQITLEFGGENYLIAHGSYSVEDDASINIDNIALTPISGISNTYYTKSQIDLLFANFSGGTDTDIYDLSSPAVISVGGILAGDVLTGKTDNQLFEEMLVPVLFPTLTNPSNSFSFNASALYEIGAVQSINFTANFNRGLINPGYGTNGFRAGLPTTYHFTGSLLTSTVSSTSLTSTQTVSYTIIAGNQSWTNSVDYSIGQQPLDSKGNNYNSPLSAGNSGSKTVSTEGVFPNFATTSVIGTETKQALVSMLTGNNVVLSLVSESGGNKQSFEMSSAWLISRPITGIQSFNTVSNNWEFQGGSAGTSLTHWTISSVTETVQGNTISYSRFRYNGTDRGATQIKIILA